MIDHQKNELVASQHMVRLLSHLEHLMEWREGGREGEREKGEGEREQRERGRAITCIGI